MNRYPGITLSVPLFFDKRGAIEYDLLDRYMQSLIGQRHIAAVYSMAFNTRYAMLDFDEVIEVNSFILEKAHSLGVSCYVGHPYIVNEKSLGKYLETIAKSNPDAVSMLYPERYYGYDDPILDFLSFPEKFGLKSIIHEMKMVSGFNGELVNWPDRLVRKALNLSSVAGIKEDSKNDEIAYKVLNECSRLGKECILAGGGKKRALAFVAKGLKTWLNGTTMFYPSVIDKIYRAILEQDQEKVDFYCDHIESPFFQNVVSKHGWHLAHKAALEFFGYGVRHERFPHATLTQSEYLDIFPTFEALKNSFESFMELE